MGGIALLALASGRPRSALPALGAAVLGLVVLSPPLARDPGFALSVLATLGLLVLAPPWAERLRSRGVPPGVAEALAVPVAATLTTAPVVAALSGQVSLVSVPANLLAAPAVAPATVLGVLAALVSPVSAGAAGWLARLAGVPVGWLAEVGERAARVPGAALSWPGGVTGALVLVAATLAVIAPRPPARAAAGRAGGCGGCGRGRGAGARRWRPAGRRPAGCSWPARSVRETRWSSAPARARRSSSTRTGAARLSTAACAGSGVRAVPLLVLTHLHADHVGGLTGVARGRAVAEIAVGPSREPAGGWQQVWRIAADPAASRCGPLPSGSGASWRGSPSTSSVRPATSAAPGPIRTTRRWCCGSGPAGRSLLLTGDVEIEAQQAMIRAGVDLRADVLKVPHHGVRIPEIRSSCVRSVRRSR